MLFRNNKIVLSLFVLSSLFFVSCDKDDGTDNHNEEELITQVGILFGEGTGTGGLVNPQQFLFSDLDGPGGNDPVKETITLSKEMGYTIGFLFWGGIDAAEMIQGEILTEGAEHLICFEATGAMPQPTIIDTDENGDPLGLEAEVTTAEEGTGTLKVVLKHLPQKDATDPCSTGDTDVEVVFDVVIQ